MDMEVIFKLQNKIKELEQLLEEKDNIINELNNALKCSRNE